MKRRPPRESTGASARTGRETGRPGLARARVESREPGRPNLEAAARLREICLQAGLDEFLAHGFEGATIDAVAQRAKASRATIYRMFGNKEALFRAVHQHFYEGRQSGLRTLLGTGLPPAEMLEAAVERIYRDAVRPRDLALTRMYVAEAHRFPELTDTLFERTLFEPLIAYLRMLKEDGVADIDDPVEAAWDVANLAGGGLRLLLQPPVTDPDALRQRARRLARLLARGWLRQRD